MTRSLRFLAMAVVVLTTAMVAIKLVKNWYDERQDKIRSSPLIDHQQAQIKTLLVITQYLNKHGRFPRSTKELVKGGLVPFEYRTWETELFGERHMMKTVSERDLVIHVRDENPKERTATVEMTVQGYSWEYKDWIF
jgi:hypothetical protein